MTFRKETGCGYIYITIAFKFDDPNKVEFLRIAGQGVNDCGASFYESLADMTTFAIRRIRNEHEARAIIKNLRYHRCNRYTPNKDRITSCSDAVGQVLQKILIKENDKTAGKKT